MLLQLKWLKSRRKVIEKTDWMDSPDGDEKSANFGFTIDRPSGNDVLPLEEIAIGYPEKTVSSNISISSLQTRSNCTCWSKWCRKIDFTKNHCETTDAAKWEIQYGTNVQFGYYDQEQATLTGNKSVLKELWDEWPLMNEKDIRTVLGRFLFSGDDVQKTVSTLSGGEKARLAFSKVNDVKSEHTYTG